MTQQWDETPERDMVECDPEESRCPMTPQQEPLVCATCKNCNQRETKTGKIYPFHCKAMDDPTFGKRFVDQKMELHFNIVGCASHSSRHSHAAPDPEKCSNDCIYKRFSQNMRNAEAREATIRNQTIDDFDNEIMKKEEWTRLELLAIIAQKKSLCTQELQRGEQR